jgi:hypothetical protein
LCSRSRRSPDSLDIGIITVREFIDGRWTGAWLTKPLDVFETREPEVETASGSGSRA